jgi:hypothetical protein
VAVSGGDERGDAEGSQGEKRALDGMKRGKKYGEMKIQMRSNKGV